MGMDLDQLWIIDNHAHPFLPERENDDPTSYWTTSLLPENTKHINHLLVFKRMTRFLGQLMGMDSNAGWKEIWNRRQEIYGQSPENYIKILFDDAKIKTLFVDIGYPTKSISGYDVDPTDLAGLVPSDVKVIVRIEPIIMDLAEKGLGYEDFVGQFSQELEKRIATNDTVALKTAIAYFTGLEIKKHSLAHIKESFKAYMSDSSIFDKAGPFFGHLVHLTFKAARKHHLPVQIHTGFGNAPLLDLTASNPLLLFELLSDKDCQQTPIVLLHAAYPYVRELAYLVNNYPNVYVDISQATQFVGVGLTTLLTELLSMAPVNKILYGSDGLGAPELFWWPAIHAKQCLTLILTDLISKKLLTQNDADEIAIRILSQNADELYL